MDNEVINFYKKNDLNTFGLISNPFTGRIYSKKENLIKAIKILKNDEKDDLNYLAEILYKKQKVEIKLVDWVDIGHVATYPKARVSSITSRVFNKLIYNKDRRSITKKSNKKLKIKNEVSYFEQIPLEIKRFYPTLLKTEFNKEFASYEMDYIGHPSLSEMYLFGKISPNAFYRIIDCISYVFDLFYKNKPLINENAAWLYSNKTKNRQLKLENLLIQKKFENLERIYFNDFVVNGCSFPSLKNSFAFLFEKLEKIQLNRPLHLGHGDLCFNNILVDPINGRINLIDPKADIHKRLNLCGVIDNFYDISKLNHSFEGFYDSVVNNLYYLHFEDIKDIQFKVYKPDSYKIINKYFRKKIVEGKIDKDTLLALTGNLFLSMLPLHLDDPCRMIGLAIIGSIYINGKDLSLLYL